MVVVEFSCALELTIMKIDACIILFIAGHIWLECTIYTVGIMCSWVGCLLGNLQKFMYTAWEWMLGMYGCVCVTHGICLVS